LIHPLIVGNLRDDPSRALRSGLIVAIETGVLLARTGLVHASHGVIAHWLSGLLGIVFWVCFGVAVLEKYVDVVERNYDFGILRILGASNTYIFAFLLQETVITSIPGALLGLALGYIVSGLFEVLTRGFVLIPIPYLLWPVLSIIAMSASLVGAILAIPRALREGVAQVLESSEQSG
jgi:predicted lysophospholipase L1 biosynthesis ABC-type transport system permease subunit